MKLHISLNSRFHWTQYFTAVADDDSTSPLITVVKFGKSFIKNVQFFFNLDNPICENYTLKVFAILKCFWRNNLDFDGCVLWLPLVTSEMGSSTFWIYSHLPRNSRGWRQGHETAPVRHFQNRLNRTMLLLKSIINDNSSFTVISKLEKELK